MSQMAPGTAPRDTVAMLAISWPRRIDGRARRSAAKDSINSSWTATFTVVSPLQSADAQLDGSRCRAVRQGWPNQGRALRSASGARHAVAEQQFSIGPAIDQQRRHSHQRFSMAGDLPLQL